VKSYNNHHANELRLNVDGIQTSPKIGKERIVCESDEILSLKSQSDGDELRAYKMESISISLINAVFPLFVCIIDGDVMLESNKTTFGCKLMR